MDAPPTLEQVQAELSEIKTALASVNTNLVELNKLQKLELAEIKKNRRVNSRTLAAVGNRLVQLLLFFAIGGSGVYLYNQLESSAKNKLAESYLNQVILPVAVGAIGAQQLYANRKEQAKLKRAGDDEEDEPVE